MNLKGESIAISDIDAIRVCLRVSSHLTSSEKSMGLSIVFRISKITSEGLGFSL